MALKDLFTMVKADRYTQDGRDQLIKAQEVETEDRKYNIGEISEKTGLQKTANGWRPPKKGGAKTLKEADRNAYNKAVKNISTERLQEAFNKREGKELTPEAKAKHEIIKTELIKRDQIKKQADFEKKIGDPAKAREQYWKEIKESSENKPDSAEKHAKAMENAKKVGIVSKVPEGWKKAEGVTTAPNGYVAITNGGSHFPKEGQQKKEIKFIKEEDFNYDDFMKEHKKREFQELYGDAIKFDEYGLPSKETVELKENFLRKKGISDPNKLSNKEFNDLAKELDDQFGINNLELSQELLVTPVEESRESATTKKKPAMSSEQRKKWEDKAANSNETVASLKNFIHSMEKPEAQANPHAKEIIDIYKKELAKRENNPKYRPEKIFDSAPRVLTGDTRIRIRK